MLAELVQYASELRTLSFGPRNLLFVDASAARSFQRRALLRKILVVGADAGIADKHWRTVANIVAE